MPRLYLETDKIESQHFSSFVESLGLELKSDVIKDVT